MVDRISLSTMKLLGGYVAPVTITANTIFTGANSKFTGTVLATGPVRLNGANTNVRGGTLLAQSNVVFTGANVNFSKPSSVTLHRNEVRLNGANTNVRGGTVLITSNTNILANTLVTSATFVARKGAPILNLYVNAYTITVADNGKYFRLANTSSAVTITIPTNAAQAFPVGAELVFVRTGSNTTSGSFTQSGGVTVNTQSGKRKLTGQYTSATVKKVATDTWDLVGNLSA